MSSNQPSWGFFTTAQQIAESNKDKIKTQRVVLITGASSGIGKETVRVLAGIGDKVVMICRDMEKCHSVAEEIKKILPEADLIEMKCDISSFTSIREFVQSFEETNLPIHVLINNAGVLGDSRRSLTVDGHELHLGTNHYGHFLLTELLLPIIKKNTPARVINVSSEAHRLCYKNGIKFDDIEQNNSFNKWLAYGQSKLANILHMREMQKQMDQQNIDISCHSLHPGIVKTNIFRQMPIIGPLMRFFAYPFMKGVQRGASTTVFLATDQAVHSHGGLYYCDSKVRGASLKENVDDIQKQLWDLSLQITKSDQ